MKRKHFPVIFFSSAIVAVVFLSTLAGYSVYIQYKKDAFTSHYRNSIFEITADIFRDDIDIYNVAVQRKDGRAAFPAVEGTIRNNSAKTVTSILLEFSFVDPDGRVLHKEWLYPVGQKYFDGAVFFPASGKTDDVILPGDTISFMHAMRNCPPEVAERVSMRRGFARPSASRDVQLVYSIKGLKVL